MSRPVAMENMAGELVVTGVLCDEREIPETIKADLLFNRQDCKTRRDKVTNKIV